MTHRTESPWLALSLATLVTGAIAGCGQAPAENSAPGEVTAEAAVATEAVWFRDGTGTLTTPAFGTAAANDLLLAFVASDGPSGGGQTATVSGAGLAWTLVVRTNAQPGTSEVWKATAAAPLANVTVQSALSRTGYHQSLTVVVLSGASGTGSVATGSAPSGAPAVTLLPSAAGSWVFAVGNDWDHATARTLGPTQAMVHEWTDTAAGDDFWVQRLLAQTTAAGAPVLMGATAPTADRWNLSAVEVLAAGSGPATAPTPTFSPAPGTYPAGLSVTLSDSATGATIHYTTNGSTPTTSSPVYTAPIAVSTTTTIRALATVPGLAPSGVAAGQYVIQGAQINGHGVVLDAGSKLLSWLPQESAYARLVDRVWNGFLHTIPTDAGTGLKLYYLYPYVTPATYQRPNWPHSPAGTYAMLTDSALLSYPMSGDATLMAAIRDVLAYHLAHGMTAASDSWASVPYAESEPGATTYRGAGSFGSGIGDGAGVLEPDKVAELGHAWLRFYEFDGTTAFRDAAIQCADQLVAHRRTSTSASLSPWPFRVRASTGAVVEGYTAHVLPAIRLFDELIRLGLGNTAAYQAVRTATWAWLMAYPMQNNVWTQYFEDVGIQTGYDTNRNQYLPGNTARFLLEHPEVDPQWLAHAQGLVAWIEANFGKTAVYGATPIGEQFTYNYQMGSHTSRYGAVNALLYERTGDPAAKEKAYRALNWASYQNRADGITVDCNPFPDQVWFTDSFGDYARHYMIAMGAVPEWAPPGEDHLLRSTSVVQSVTYASGRVDYRTFDGSAQEVLRLSFTPQAVVAGGVPLPQRADLLQQGWTFDPALDVLRVRHDAATTIAVLSVSPVVTVSPATVAVLPGGAATFTASGGSGTGYVWSFSINASGGTIDRGTGAYTAGLAGGVTDVIRATDSLGASGTASVTVEAVPAVGVSPGSLAFGGQLIGTSSAMQALTISNAGSAPATFSSIAVTGTDRSQFVMVSACPVTPETLAAGASCEIDIAFAPGTPGTKGAGVTLSSDDPASPVITVVLGGMGTAPPIARPCDFDGDGKSDLLWRNGTTGGVQVWRMNGATIAAAADLGKIPLAWRIERVGTFDGDNKADILWRNASTGEVFLWTMNGLAHVGSGSLGTVPLQWQIAEAGDFDGDGKSDVLWRNGVSGQVYLWLMDGYTHSIDGSLGTVNLDWQIARVGDFDGDGKADILWRNTASGEVYLWLMNGLARGTSGSLGKVPIAMQIAGVGDFDGDGKADILWRNTASGEVSLWLMNGLALASGGSLGGLALDWQIAEVGDYDGDGMADVLWRNAGTGELQLWLMNGTSVPRALPVGTIGLDWIAEP